ncbi:unnamed protein product [Dicrocoelium dendriticum]|nr:unnamed protein product [Dicrocoelium dendriticum]
MPSKITKWLTAFKPSSPEAVEELISWMYTNVKLLEDIEEILDKLSSSLIGDICQRLLVFYTSKSLPLQRFSIFLFPCLIHAYLSHFAEEDTPSSGTRRASTGTTDVQQNTILLNLASVESCLLEIGRHFATIHPESTKPACLRSDPNFRVPSLAEPSVFHDAVPTAESYVDDAGVFPPSCVPVPSNRIPAVVILIRDYLDCILSIDLVDARYGLLALHSMTRFCKLCDRIVSLSKRPRIAASTSLLIDLLFGLDVVLYKLDDVDQRADSIRETTLVIRGAVLAAVKGIEKRSVYDCASAALLVCRAILHSRSAQYGPRMVPGLQVTTVSSSAANAPEDSSQKAADDEEEEYKNPEVTRAVRPPPSTGVEVITNASFRPETLPEDIPINEQHSASSQQNTSASGKLGMRGKESLDRKPNATDGRYRKGNTTVKLVPINQKAPATE